MTGTKWNARAWAALGCALLIASCGGGGGGSSPPPVTSAPTTPTTDDDDDETDPLGEVGTVEEERVRLFETLGEEIFAIGYANVRTRADELDTAIDGYCDAPSADRAAVEDAWRQAMAAWQSVQLLAVGPVEESNRRYRLQFFPDVNEAVERGVDSALAGDGAITEQTIANASVGAQGLPAVEYLLFEIGGWDDAADGPRRCELAVAIAANIATIAAEIAEPWQEGGSFIDEFVNFSGTYFNDSEDVLTAVFEAVTHHAEFIADRKLRDAVDDSNPNILESHYAENSAANIRANLDALRGVFDTGEEDVYRLRDYLERAVVNAEGISEQIAGQLDLADDALEALEGSLEDVVAGDAGGDAEQVRATIRELANLFLDSALDAGVNIGFNNQDGD